MEREEAQKIFSKGLAKFMFRTGLNGEAVAKILGIKSECISVYKSGKNLPKLPSVFTLVENGMRLDEIFGEELAAKMVAVYQENKAKASPMETAMQAKQILNLLLEQVGKMQ